MMIDGATLICSPERHFAVCSRSPPRQWPTKVVTLERGEITHPPFARLYMRLTSRRQARGEDEHRRKLLTGLCSRDDSRSDGQRFQLPVVPGWR